MRILFAASETAMFVVALVGCKTSLTADIYSTHLRDATTGTPGAVSTPIPQAESGCGGAARDDECAR